MSANHVLELSRLIKGPEEIRVIERVTEANEAAIRRMMEVARPKVEEATLWVEMAAVLIRHTGDYPARLSFGSNGRPANAGNSMALPIRLEAGGVLSQEIDARLRGYRAQSNHSILIGKKNAGQYREAMSAAIEIFHALAGWVKPGETIGGLLSQFVNLAEARGARGSSILVHTNGLGSDRPRVGPGPFAKDGDMVIEPGFTFTIKTHVEIKSTGVRALVGDPITVTATGARRLGFRELVPFVAG
ncbi:MAG: M24 family metallopeptidase [Deltaproteobacteria bacterium]|nr:M24 family metallopeptidase [Deltaproteobacteria bacterium]